MTIKYLKIIFIALLIFNAWACNEPVSTTLFNQDWQFAITNMALNEKGAGQVIWEPVSLPHSAVIEPKVIDQQWQGICWYRKSFRLPSGSKGKELFLKFEGAMNVCEIWVNGQKLITKAGGYLPVVVSFTKVAKFDTPNEVLVRLDNTDNEITGPKPLHQLDFNMYGGLYRDAYLIIKNPVYITDPVEAGIPAGGGVFVTYPLVTDERAEVQVKTHVRNSSENESIISIIHELWDGKSKVSEIKTSGKSVLSGSDMEDISAMMVDNPKLWSPQTPFLYTLKTKVLSKNKVLDEIETRIGIRHIEITTEGFYINGEKLFLRGVNRHQDYPYIGYALSNHAQYRDALKIKESGFDYVRLSHYPHSPGFMDACDELGLVVVNAILGWQYYSTNPDFQNQIFQTGRDLIRRDRNHPCVIAWELSLNESWMDEYFIDSLHAITHEEYPGSQCYSAGWQEYGYDIYLQARQHRIEHFVEPQKPYIVSEYGDWEYYAMNAGLNQDSWQNLLQAERSSRQLLADGEIRLLQQATNVQEAHNDNFNTPAFADGYWVMFDYNRGYSNDLESSGIMSIDRLPKFSHYFFRSQRPPSEQSDLFHSGPMVFIASWWNKESPLHVRVFSNCEQVELFLNGNSMGMHAPDQNNITHNLAHPPFTFILKDFVKGELTAKGYIDGGEVATHSVKTPGSPAKIDLVADVSGRPLKAGCKDAVFIYARITDSVGTVLPVNDMEVQFSIEGDAWIVNPHPITSEAGIATALLQSGSKKAPIKVVARANGLLDGKLEILPE